MLSRKIRKNYMSEDLKYPIGKFDKNFEFTAESRRQLTKDIGELPQKLREAVENLTDEQLETPYRPEGWTVRQTIHHVADSHLNSIIRFKLALTEDVPAIRPYYEERWAELSDSRLPLDASFKIIDGLHLRWTTLLDSMSVTDFDRKLLHPDSGEWTLGQMLGLYGWHGRHHTAHITKLRERNGW